MPQSTQTQLQLPFQRTLCNKYPYMRWDVLR